MMKSCRTPLPQGTIQRRTFFRFVKEYERVVQLTLGSYSATKAPGFRLDIPIFQQSFPVDLRTRVHELGSAPHMSQISTTPSTVLALGPAFLALIDRPPFRTPAHYDERQCECKCNGRGLLSGR